MQTNRVTHLSLIVSDMTGFLRNDGSVNEDKRKSDFIFCLFIFLSLILISNFSIAQDSLYARSVINTLTSESYHGRGYVKNGDVKAAQFIADEFRRLNLLPLTENYFQPFDFPVNTFPSKMKICIDGKKLIPGRDYIVHPSSSSVKGKFKIFNADKPPSDYTGVQVKDKVVFVQKPDSITTEQSKLFNEWDDNTLDAKGIVMVEPTKLTWSVSSNVFSYPDIRILKSALPKNPKEIQFNIKNKFIQHTAKNVIAEIKGKVIPDSFIVITAHLDHLGMMGTKTCFPGANDNASGIAMMLNLAKSFSQKNYSKYSLLFIAFAGEEAGLLGSKFYTEHPVVPLEKIKFLINLDLLGTGDDGLMVVNGALHQQQFNMIDSLNNVHHYLNNIGKRGKARNSDHYYFSEKGVPAFFLYTLGGIKAYHDIDDKGETLPLTKYKEVFRLITDFINTF